MLRRPTVSRMAEYATFADVVASLPSSTTVSGTPLDAFRIVETAGAGSFVEPIMSRYEVAVPPQATLISARGATGKSAMAGELSTRLGAPLWSLGEDKAVSGDALTARLSAFLGAVDPLAEAASGRVPLLIIDAMDEARLRVTGVSWDEFMASLVQYARAGVHLVILGRKRTIEDVWFSLAEAVEDISWYEISHFNESQQSEYVDLRALRGAQAPSEVYATAKAAVLEHLNGATDSSLDEAFAGYAPVLDAVAALLKPPVNYQAVINDFQSSTVAGTRLKILRRILDSLLHREQSKVEPLAQDLGLSAADAYSPQEQLEWLTAELLGGSQPTFDWCPEPKRAEYAERVIQFLSDHPFREGDLWASPVFSSYVAVKQMDTAEPSLLVPIAGMSGLFYEFAASGAPNQSSVVDEAQFAALHASLMAGQWVSSTSVVSVRSDDNGDASEPETATAQLVLSQPDETSTVLEATVVLGRAGRLALMSPLANVDVEFAGVIEVTSSSTSIDLGPEVFLRARSIELAGSSLQVSKDTLPDEVSGPTVELEATESFHTQAALIGSVPVSDLSIVVPISHKLFYPWVQYRSDPDNEAGEATDDRARRFLNKVMSLARRHGHRGQRAVFIKKLEGRQGLGREEFHRAVATLVRLGVVREGGDMLFLTDEWDQHRYDGKGREGMVSYEHKREVWGSRRRSDLEGHRVAPVRLPRRPGTRPGGHEHQLQPRDSMTHQTLGTASPRQPRLRERGPRLRVQGGELRSPLALVHLRLACRTRVVWQYRPVPSLSRLLPPNPASPGSGCPQLQWPAATGHRWVLSPHPVVWLVAHRESRGVLPVYPLPLTLTVLGRSRPTPGAGEQVSGAFRDTRPARQIGERRGAPRPWQPLRGGDGVGGC